MTTQFVIRPQKRDAAGRCPIYLLVYFSGNRLTHATGEKCKPADWKADRQQFRRSYPLAEEANQLLGRLTADVLLWWRQLRATGDAPTLAGLRDVLRPAHAPEVVMPEQPRSITVAFAEYQLALRARGYASHTLRQRKLFGNWLASYEQARGEILAPTTYDLAAHDRMLSYLRFDKGLAQNTVAAFVRSLKTFLRWCREERGLAVPVELRKLQSKHTNTLKMWLAADDLTALAAAVLPSHLVPVRDVLLFCCYTGLRYSDVQALQAGNLETWHGARVLRLAQTKTRTAVSIYLTSAAGAILDKYAAGGERMRLLPLLANQVMNRHLKQVGKYAGLATPVMVSELVAGELIKKSVPKWELLTMHTARHTFATQSLLRGMPVEVLQKVMGHANIQTTLIYAKVVEDLQHQTMRRVWEGTADAGTSDAAGTLGAVCVVKPGAA